MIIGVAVLRRGCTQSFLHIWMHRDDLAESMLSTVSRFYYIRLREMIWNIHDTLWYKRRNDRNEIVANFKSLSLFVWASNGRNRLIFLFIASPKNQNFCTIFALYRLSKLSNNLLSLFASFVVEENIFIIASSDTKQNGKWLDTFASSQSVVFQISAVLFYLAFNFIIFTNKRTSEASAN